MHTRRTAFQLLGAAALLPGAAMAQPRPQPPARTPPALRKPPRLRSGDTVGVIQPAGWISDHAEIDRAIERVRAMGLVPLTGQHLRDRHGYLAGTDEARAADVNAMFADRSVKAVFAARGGWGCARLLPYLNWEVIAANPKLLVGFSDITALHLAIAARGGFPTIHGPNVGSNWGPRSTDTFRRLAFDAALPVLEDVPAYVPPRVAVTPPPGAASSPGSVPPPIVSQPLPPPRRIETLRPGRATGRLLGGNLTVLSALMGTPYLPSFDGAILFIEDVEEAEYRVDRMLTQLALSGLLRGLAGVVFGQCTRCATGGAASGGFTLSDVLNRHLRPLGVPAFAGAWFGHISDQLSIPVGVRAEIDANAGTIRVLEPVVA
jgi:muramoyltetrapeptide carboxypeptidase